MELGPDSHIVARQQLTNPAFYRAVRAGLLDGTVTAVDQRIDELVIDGRPVPLSDETALQALAASQETWVGKPAPLTAGLFTTPGRTA